MKYYLLLTIQISVFYNSIMAAKLNRMVECHKDYM